jgi:transcriptional regulator with XRE-family HTH domain
VADGDGPHAHLVAELLRSRRERLAPADVGLPAGTRRRTKGLRREEVAQLAGISTTYYTFLEQGRNIRPSRVVLDSLADALRLSDVERQHLHNLAAGTTPPSRPEPAPETLAAGLADLVDELDPRPTYVTGRYWDVLAWNRAARSLWTDWSAVPRPERNLLWWMFTAPAARWIFVDWEAEAAGLLAEFREAAGRELDDAGFTGMLERLRQASPEARSWWLRHDVGVPSSSTKQLVHPDLGVVELRRIVLRVADNDDQQLVTFEVVGEDAREKVAGLVEDFSLGVLVRGD